MISVHGYGDMVKHELPVAIPSYELRVESLKARVDS